LKIKLASGSYYRIEVDGTLEHPAKKKWQR
jgi:hypothetical protein